MTNPSVGLYVRVSTQAQKFDAQLAELKAYCARRGWKKVHVYSEKESGANDSRTVLNELLMQARAGKIDVIVIWKIDRLGRSMLHFLQIVQELKKLGIGIIVTTEGIDTTVDNPGAELQMNFMALMASHGRQLISDRTKIGQAWARKHGRFAGRPPKHEKELATAKKMRAQGKSFSEISKKVGLSAGYLCRALKTGKGVAK